MYEAMENNLIVIENGRLTTYRLDDRIEWTVGRASKDSIPDIRLHPATISRKHGSFKNMDGIWFYLDYNGKNGTVHNGKHVKAGVGGRIRPIMLNDGDVFIFGGSGKAVINSKTVWAIFITYGYNNDWYIEDVAGCSKLRFVSGTDVKTIDNPEMGEIVRFDSGMAIYMGDVTYYTGNINIICS